MRVADRISTQPPCGRKTVQFPRLRGLQEVQSSLLQLIAEIAGNHHQRWDERGVRIDDEVEAGRAVLLRLIRFIFLAFMELYSVIARTLSITLEA